MSFYLSVWVDGESIYERVYHPRADALVLGGNIHIDFREDAQADEALRVEFWPDERRRGGRGTTVHWCARPGVAPADCQFALDEQVRVHIRSCQSILQ